MYGSVRGSASMLDSGKTMRSTGSVIRVARSKWLFGQVARRELGVGQLAVLVVALHERDAQRRR